MHITGNSMRKTLLMQSALAAFVTAFVLASPSYAATVAFPDQVGATVTFTGITEVNDEAAGVSLFGGLSTFENTLDFDAFNFRHDSLTLPPSLDGRLSFEVNALPGFKVASVTVQEVGSYTTINEGPCWFLPGWYCCRFTRWWSSHRGRHAKLRWSRWHDQLGSVGVIDHV